MNGLVVGAAVVGAVKLGDKVDARAIEKRRAAAVDVEEFLAALSES